MRKAWMLVLWLLSLQVTAAPLQVTELRGSVQQGERPLRLLDTLADAASDRRFVVAGPGRVTIEASGPVLAGSGSVQMLAPRRAAAPRQPAGTVMAGAIMRTSSSPSAAEVLLPLAQADFSWRNRPHLGDWRFQLFDAAGMLLHEARVAERHYRLPPTVLLAPERAYYWQVSWDDGGTWKQAPRESGRSMATAVVSMPAAHASLAARLGAALQLRDNGQLAEARALAPELFAQAR